MKETGELRKSSGKSSFATIAQMICFCTRTFGGLHGFLSDSMPEGSFKPLALAA